MAVYVMNSGEHGVQCALHSRWNLMNVWTALWVSIMEVGWEWLSYDTTVCAVMLIMGYSKVVLVVLKSRLCMHVWKEQCQTQHE